MLKDIESKKKYMVINKHNNIVSPSVLLCEGCQKKIAACSDGRLLTKGICGCGECGFDVNFEDENNIYESNAVAAFDLAVAYLAKGKVLALLDGNKYKIVVVATNKMGILLLQERLGNLAAFGVFVSEKQNSHERLVGMKKEPTNGEERFLLGDGICVWSVQTPETILNVSTPRTMMEMILCRELNGDLFVLDGKKIYSDEWELKMDLKNYVDYFLIKS